MPSSTATIVLEAKTKLDVANSQLQGLHRTLKDIEKTVNGINGGIPGATGGSGNPVVPGVSGGGNSGPGGINGIASTRLSKIILENQSAVRKLRTANAKEFETSSRVIDRALEQEGKRIDQHTARIKKLSAAYEQNREWIDSGIIKNPEFLKRTDRTGKLLHQAIGDRNTAQENSEELKKLKFGDPKTLVQQLGGWANILGAIGGLGVLGATVYHDSQMREGRLAASIQQPSYSLIQQAGNGNLALGSAMADGSLGRNIGGATGTGWSWVKGIGLMVGGAGAAVFGGPLGIAAGAGAAYAGYNTIANRGITEANDQSEALTNSALGVDAGKRTKLENYYARAGSLRSAYQAFGPTIAEAHYSRGQARNRGHSDTDALAFALRAGGGSANNLDTALMSLNAGINNSTSILNNMSIGGRDIRSQYRSLINNGLSDTGDATVASNFLESASSNLLGANGVAGPAYLNALMSGASGVNAGRQRQILSQNSVGMNALSNLTSGGIDPYQSQRNLSIVLSNPKFRNMNAATQNFLASADANTMSQLVKYGDKARGITAKDARWQMNKEIDSLNIRPVKDDNSSTPMYKTLNGKFGGKLSLMMHAKGGDTNGSYQDQAAKIYGENVPGLGGVGVLGDTAARGFVHDMNNFNDGKKNDKDLPNRAEDTPAEKIAEQAANFEKILHSLSEPDVSTAIKGLSEIFPVMLGGIKKLYEYLETKKFIETQKANQRVLPNGLHNGPVPTQKTGTQ